MQAVAKFRVIELPGTVTKTVYDYVQRQIKVGELVTADGDVEQKFRTVRDRVAVEKEEPAGFLVHMTRGHSIRVRSRQELAALGFDQEPDLVDPESGETIPQTRLGSISGGMPIEALIGNYHPDAKTSAKGASK